MQMVIDDEKTRKSPPELEKEAKSNERDMSLSMAPLHIPLGPLGKGLLMSNVFTFF